MLLVVFPSRYPKKYQPMTSSTNLGSGLIVGRTEQLKEQLLSTISVRLKSPKFVASPFFSILFTLSFNLPSGLGASGFLFFSFSPEIQFYY